MLTSKEIEELGFTLNENRDWFSNDRLLIAAANVIYKHSDYLQIWRKGDVPPQNKQNLLLFQGCIENKKELEVLIEQVDTRLKLK